MANGLNDLGSKKGRYIGGLVGMVAGSLILFPKVILLIVLVVAGYLVGALFDRKSAE